MNAGRLPALLVAWSLMAAPTAGRGLVPSARRMTVPAAEQARLPAGRIMGWPMPPARLDTIRVRGVLRDTTLVLVSTASGAAVRADVVLPLIGGTVRDVGGGRWTIEVPGASITLMEGAPFAMSKGVVLPLVAAPLRRDGALLLPLQILAGVVPQLGHDVLWDADDRELRVFQGIVRRTPPPAARATAPTRTAASTPSNTSLGVPPTAGSVSPSGRAPARHHMIIVDAGHGGPDAGMHGPIGGAFTIYEKDITLAVAKRLADALRDRGAEILMTRTTDTLIALSDRGRIANQHHGDLFISIHVNAANLNWKNPAAARGFETYFLAEAKTEDERRVAQMENDVIRFETAVDAKRDDPLGFIINDMAQNEHLRESSDLAEAIQARLRTMHPGPSRGVKQAGFRVLVTAFMPAVLVEIGFGTNAAEAAWISSAAGQAEIATAVADAAMEYLSRYDRRVGAGTPGKIE